MAKGARRLARAERMSRLEPTPGRRPGSLEFRFARSGLMLAVDFDRRGGDGRPWISVYLWDRRKAANPLQLAWVHARLEECYLQAASPDLGPALCFTCAHAFALRPAEYDALRASLLAEGLEHHVPAGEAKETQAARPAPSRSNRMYEGEVEGCGGDAELDRTRA